MKKLFKPKTLNPGDKSVIEREEPIEDVGFNVFKFNPRPRPEDKRQVLVICCFSEFGCEVVGAMYCIPDVIQRHYGKYKIVVGWHGRDYLYRHLVDEFWEVKEGHQWLREYCRAFHHESKNLTRIEKSLTQYGRVVTSNRLGQIAVGARCRNKDCLAFWGVSQKVEKCPYCESEDVQQSILGDVKSWKKKAVRIPFPSEEKASLASKYLGERSVGVFARGRTCYGRNLSPEFYIKLIGLLEKQGYSPVWLGEKQSTLPCPVGHIIDFSRMPESRDLETTLAIVSRCCFTIQFWTASTRLAGIMGVPYILFESPDQIWGRGQEGARRNLCDFGSRKLVISHFLNVKKDHETALKYVAQAIAELEQANYEDVFGLLESEIVAPAMKRDNRDRIGG